MKYKGKRVTSEMMLYNDLVVNDGENFIEELGLTDLNVYKRKPCKCSDCGSKNIIGLEVLGTKEGILMWICDHCDALYLKYDLKKTEAWIEKGKGFWTTPNDWPIPSIEKFN